MQTGPAERAAAQAEATQHQLRDVHGSCTYASNRTRGSGSPGRAAGVARCYAGRALGCWALLWLLLLRRHLSYAHRLKIVDNRKKNRTNCSNKQQTTTTTATTATRSSLQLVFGLSDTVVRGCVCVCELAGIVAFWGRVHTKFERVIQHAIIKLLKDNKHTHTHTHNSSSKNV